ncbi:MAG: hypothetical protein Q7V62_16855, partial [Actinomycetota bacterium]|nr:hypothetical protein [Actinomycetota bacterium]
PWNTVAISWGVIAFYLLVVIQVSSWTMKWLPRRLWHAVHLLSYALFAMVTVHGFMAGSDSTNIVFFAVACGGIAILTFALVARVLQGRAKRVQRVARLDAQG